MWIVQDSRSVEKIMFLHKNDKTENIVYKEKGDKSE